MINKFLAFAAIVLLCVACTSDPATPNDDVLFEGTQFVKATIDGASYSSAVSIQTGSVDSDGNVDFGLMATDMTGLQLLLGFSSNSAGTFTFNDGSNKASMSTMINSGGALVIYTANSGTLTVDKIDLSAKRAKGRFSGTLKTSAGDTKTVTNGTFEGKWN